MPAPCTTYDPTLPRGFSKLALRRARARHGLARAVEIHHVIPREFRAHPQLAARAYDVDAAYNTIFMPSATYPTHCQRPQHTGGHPQYNAFVRKRLDGCETREGFMALLFVCHWGSRGRCGVPWR
jgi:hypothetical protein